jgi:hypothetical protein
VYFEVTVDGSQWYMLPVTPVDGGSAVTQTAAPGLWRVSVSPWALVRCRLGGVVVGAVTVTGLGSTASL